MLRLGPREDPLSIVTEGKLGRNRYSNIILDRCHILILHTWLSFNGNPSISRLSRYLSKHTT